METILTIKWPMKRIPQNRKRDEYWKFAPWQWRWLGWLYTWGGGSCGNCAGQTNTTRHLTIFRWHVLTLNRNEWHDRSDEERAAEYLRKWSECEKELRGLRLLQMGDEVTNPELRKLLRESLGVNLDEGTIR